MKIPTVKEYLTRRYGDCTGQNVYYKSQEGDGDCAFMAYEKFVEKYGERNMGDDYQDDFCLVDGTRCLNQYIKRVL